MTSPSAPPLVHFADIGVVREDSVLLLAASGLVHGGEVLAVRGPNGAGKTTLLRVVAGLTTPTAGSVSVAGRAPDDRDRIFRAALAAHIGPPPTARDLTVVEHLKFVAATWGGRVAPARDLAHDLLEELGLTALARRYPHELSSGQSQLAGLALVLARPFEVLLLDEPEQRLDAERLAMVTSAIARRRDAGAAVLLASHSERLVASLADRELHLEGAG